VKDAAGEEYKVGDYVFCAVHARCSSVDTYAGKVVKVNDSSVTVFNNNSRKNKSVLQTPERHLIISEELALRVNPKLKGVVIT
jgi:ribosomal protein L21E